MNVKRWGSWLQAAAHAGIVRNAFFCLLAVGIGLMMWLFYPEKEEAEQFYTSASYRALPENTLDVLAVGSQRMQASFNPASYYSATGFYSFVLHAPCNTLSDSYRMLEEALETQHPAVVLVDVSPLLSTSRACIIGDHALRNVEESDTAMGHVYQETTAEEIREVETYELRLKPVLTDTETSFITRIASLCESRHATPVFVNPPFDQNQFDADKLAAINEYVLRKHLAFIDFNSLAASIGYTIGLDGDGYVTNTQGAEMVTEVLVEQTADLVRNHRTDALLEERLTRQVQDTIQILFAQDNPDVSRLLKYAEKYPVVGVLQCRDTARLHLTKEEIELFSKLGIDCRKNTSLYAIIDHGNIVALSRKPFAQNYNGWKIELEEQGISVNDESTIEASPMHIWFLSENPAFSKALNRPVAVTKSAYGLWQKNCDFYTCK